MFTDREPGVRPKMTCDFVTGSRIPNIEVPKMRQFVAWLNHFVLKTHKIAAYVGGNESLGSLNPPCLRDRAPTPTSFPSLREDRRVS